MFFMGDVSVVKVVVVVVMPWHGWWRIRMVRTRYEFRCEFYVDRSLLSF